MSKRFFIFIFTLVGLISFSQTKENQNFKDLDSLAKMIKYEDNLPELVNRLTTNCKTEEEKYRAIFIWITHNIGYDYKTYNQHRKPVKIKCKGKEDCEKKLAQLNNEIIDRVLSKKIAICDGYSKLFKRMCDMANLNCSIVEGYIKNSPYQIGNMGIQDHAWNVIRIDNEYYNVDATWASGYCTKNKKGKLDSFVKDYNDYYWLTENKDFFRNHFPKDRNWMNDTGISIEYYKNQPFIEASQMPNLRFSKPESGIVNVKKGEKIKFEFMYDELVDKIQVNTNLYKNPSIWKTIKGKRELDKKAIEKQKFINYQQVQNTFSFDITTDNEKLNYIEIIFDHNRVAKFKIIVSK